MSHFFDCSLIYLYIMYIQTIDYLYLPEIYFTKQKENRKQKCLPGIFCRYYTANSDPILQVEADQRSNASVSARLVIDQRSLRWVCTILLTCYKTFDQGIVRLWWTDTTGLSDSDGTFLDCLSMFKIQKIQNISLRLHYSWRG